MFKRRNILIAVTAIALILPAGAVAFAAADAEIPQSARDRPAIMAGLTDEQREAVQQARTESMQEAIAELAENGAITQDEADKLLEIKSAPEGTAEENDGKKVLTDEQKKAVMQEIAALWKEAAANLVEEGTLTQEEADAISVVPQIKPGDKGGFGILTEEQQTALNEAMKAKFESSLADLADEGTITPEQADQILNDKGGPHMGSGGRSGFGGPPGFNGKPDSGDQSGEE